MFLTLPALLFLVHLSFSLFIYVCIFIYTHKYIYIYIRTQTQACLCVHVYCIACIVCIYIHTRNGCVHICIYGAPHGRWFGVFDLYVSGVLRLFLPLGLYVCMHACICNKATTSESAIWKSLNASKSFRATQKLLNLLNKLWVQDSKYSRSERRCSVNLEA